MRLLATAALTSAFVMLTFSMASAAQNYVITIKDHKFSPSELMVPANEKVKLVVKNMDPTPEEFESHDLNREKIVAGNAEIIVHVGPLQPGSYKYFGEFNQDTAQGVITVK